MGRTRRSVLAGIAVGATAGCVGRRHPDSDPGPETGTDGVPAETVRYADDHGVTAGSQSLDVYAAEAGGGPVVVYVHGGGWVGGDRRNVGAKPAWVTDRHDGVLVSVGYRLSSFGDGGAVHPDHVRDVCRAVAWVLDSVEEYGGDPGAVSLLGHSAGAHLVSLAATAGEYAREAGWDPADLSNVFAIDAGLYDLVWAYERGSQRRRFIDAAFGDGVAARREGSPQHHVDDADADLPGFTFAFTNAFRRRAVRRFAGALSGVGVETTAVDRTDLQSPGTGGSPWAARGGDRSERTDGAGLPAHLAVNRRIGSEGDVLTAVLDRKLPK